MIYIGAHVVDIYGDEGIVVKIIEGINTEEHGSIYVWQMNKLEYGADNCEHYPHFEWNKILKILK